MPEIRRPALAEAQAARETTPSSEDEGARISEEMTRPMLRDSKPPPRRSRPHAEAGRYAIVSPRTERARD
jgi:hypothetical protein